MCSFTTQLLKGASTGRTVIKSGRALVNPTVKQIDKAMQSLTANVQGSISRALTSDARKLLHTKSGQVRSGYLVIPFVAVIFSGEDTENDD